MAWRHNRLFGVIQQELFSPTPLREWMDLSVPKTAASEHLNQDCRLCDNFRDDP